MDEKTGRILEIINNRRDSTKLDIKNISGYSMTTVLKAVDKLVKSGFITCDQRKVKRGKPPSIININEKGYIAIVENTTDKCSISLVGLNGVILHQKTFKEHICKEILLSTISEYTENGPLFIYILSDESIVIKDCNTFNCEIIIEEYWQAMGKLIKYKLNTNSVALFSIGESIIYTYIDTHNKYFSKDVGNLETSIINIEQGRLSLEQVLAYKPYSSYKDSSDNKCFAVALSDMLNQIKSFVNPDKVAIIKNEYDHRLEGLTLDNCFIDNFPDKSEIAFNATFLSLYGK